VIRFSDIVDNPVMNTASALTVGRVGSLVVDPAARRVVAIGVRKSKGPGDTLPWDGITAIGPDAVTVDSEQRIADAPGELRRQVSLGEKLIGHRVLDDHGRELGHVRDVEFDPRDGSVVTLILKDAYVDGARLLGLGSYAVVVRALAPSDAMPDTVPDTVPDQA
jgi:sporulation protein YlmC with PRC-barrel domain